MVRALASTAPLGPINAPIFTASHLTFALYKGKMEKGLRTLTSISAMRPISGTISTARLPCPSFYRVPILSTAKEGIEGGFHPRNESLSNGTNLASTRSCDFGTFCGAKMVEQLDKNRITENRTVFSHLPTTPRASPPFPFPREKSKKGFAMTSQREAALSTTPRALPPLPVPREELKKDLPSIHPRNESIPNRTNLASTRSRDFGTFCGGRNG